MAWNRPARYPKIPTSRKSACASHFSTGVCGSPRRLPFGEFWPGGEVLPCNGGRADVAFLPMMQSRRLSPLARAVSAVAWHSRQQCGDMPSVFFSSHGESQYYFEMLQVLAGGEDVSPSRFSLCVHNAIAGLASFHSASYLPYVSLAGGTEGMFAAFLEAGGILLETSKVLVVWYEQALPDAYRAYLATSETTFALAMVLTRAGGSDTSYGLFAGLTRAEQMQKIAHKA